MDVETLELSEWEAALPTSGTEVFHRPEALEVLADHADASLYLFGGFKGQQPVALLPVFVQERAVGSAVLSPPPSMGVPRLGPLTMPTSPKRRKREKINREFAREVLDRLDADASVSDRLEAAGLDNSVTDRLTRAGLDPSLTIVRMECGVDYPDPRPYAWEGYAIAPRFTYVLDVGSSSPDDLLKSASKSLRREIRDGKDLDVEVSVEGIDAAQTVYEDTKDRYDEQGEGFPMQWAYVRDLLEALDERFRVYVARDSDGEYVSGITVLYSDDRAYFWQGGTRAIYEGTSVNSLLHWAIIEDVAEDPPVDGVHSYDLMGANTENLCRYKAKFGADLVPYYVIESKGAGMGIAKKAYSYLYH
jgi:hypothetical protein